MSIEEISSSFQKSLTFATGTSIPILGRANVWEWSQALLLHATTHHFVDYITGEAAPDPVLPNADHNNYWKVVERLEKLSGRKSLALQTIFTSLDNANKAIYTEYTSELESKLIPTKMTAKLMYDHFMKTHGSNKLHNVLTILKTFNRLQISTVEEIPDYIDKVRSAIRNLELYMKASKENPISSKLLGLQILAQLEGERFDNVKLYFDTSTEGLLTPSNVLAKLTSLYETLKGGIGGGEILSGIKEEPLGLAANTMKKDKYCDECKKKGHIKENCFKLDPKKYDEYLARKKAREEGGRGGTSTTITTGASAVIQEEEPQSSNIFTFGFCALNPSALVATSNHMVILDSGASRHMFRSSDSFESLSTLSSPIEIGVAMQGASIIAYKSGTAKIITQTGRTLLFKNALLVNELSHDLISVGVLNQLGFKVEMDGNEATVLTKDKRTIFTASRKGETPYYVDVHSSHTAASTTISNDDKFDLWHRRLGHLNGDALNKMMKDNGLVGTIDGGMYSSSSYFCTSCTVAKSHRHPISKGPSTSASIFLGRIHADLIGPIQTTSIGKAKYLLTILDDYSRFLVSIPLANKSDTFIHFKRYVNMMESESGKKVIRFRSDRGGEFVSKEFNDYLAEKGITREQPAANAHEQNGKIERLNRTIMERATTVLYDSGLANSLWAEAANYSTHCYNLSPHSGNQFQIPVVKFFENSIVTPNYKPSLKNLRPFGCAAYFHIDKSNRKKLDDKAEMGVMLGYEKGSKSYRIWYKGSVIIRGEVSFNEHYFPHFSSTNSSPDKNVADCWNGGVLAIGSSGSNEEEEEIEVRVENGQAAEDGPENRLRENRAPSPELRPPQLQPLPPLPPPVQQQPLPPPPQPIQPQPIQPQRNVVPIRTSGRIKLQLNPTLDRTIAERNLAIVRENKVEDHATAAFIIEEGLDIDSNEFNYFALATNLQVDLDNPTYNQAMSGAYSESWKEAIDKEVKGLVDQGTGELIPPSSSQKSIGCRFVLTTKRDEAGNFIKRKARYVAKGYLQQYGTDFNDTYSSVAKSDSIRIILAKTCQLDLELASFDVTAAFLASEIDIEGIIVDPPPSLAVGKYSGWKWLLKKSLYGLKQAPKCWKETIDKFLKGLGFITADGDDCFYILKKEEGFIYLTVHVDDGLIAGSSQDLLKWFKKELTATFNSTWEDNPTSYLGMNIRRNRSKGTLRIGHQTYLKSLIEKFGHSNSNSKSLPLPTAAKLNAATEEEIREGKEVELRELVGGLMWVALGTRPDIAHATSTLARHFATPSIRIFKLAEHVLLYLAGTIDYYITYQKEPPGLLSPQVFSDSDYAGDLTTRRSQTAFVFQIAGAPVSWMSKLQPTVALSTCEAEYMALTETSKHAIWITKVLKSMDLPSSSFNFKSPVHIHGDNEGSHALALNNTDHKRNKHIDIRFHFIREAIINKQVKLVYVPTKDNVADILTKGMDSKDKFERLRMMLGVRKFIEN